MPSSASQEDPKNTKDSVACAGLAKRPYIGGQAVIEGVMMRSPRSFAIVVRRRSSELVVRERRMPDARKGVAAWPLVRGVVTLVEALRLGSQALRFSVEQYEEDLEAEEREKEAQANEKAKKAAKKGALNTLTLGLLSLATADVDGSKESQSASKSSSGKAMTWLALLFAVGLFVFLPQAGASGVSRLFDLSLDIRSAPFQILTGVFKLIIVVAYMLVIRRVPEIRRVFEYHGAEHKAIATYEAGEELQVANARSKSRLHPRCGTTFIVMVVFVSILMFTAIGPFLPRLPVGGLGTAGEFLLFFLMKLPFLPVIAAITYEIQRLTARYCLRGPLRAVLYPGFAVQGITTIDPDDQQLEIALASLRATLWREEASPDSTDDLIDSRFASFSDLMDQPGYSHPRAVVSSEENDAAPREA